MTAKHKDALKQSRTSKYNTVKRISNSKFLEKSVLEFKTMQDKKASDGQDWSNASCPQIGNILPRIKTLQTQISEKKERMWALLLNSVDSMSLFFYTIIYRYFFFSEGENIRI